MFWSIMKLFRIEMRDFFNFQINLSNPWKKSKCSSLTLDYTKKFEFQKSVTALNLSSIPF